MQEVEETVQQLKNQHLMVRNQSHGNLLLGQPQLRNVSITPKQQKPVINSPNA